MEKGIRSSKWGISFLCAVIVLFIFVCLSVFLIDPFFQFGVHDNQYLLNAAYVDAGLIKNYDYDAVIIGSCMVENYDIETFNNAFGVKAVKIGCGGLGSDGVLEYLLLANRVGKAKNYYINIDFASFTWHKDNGAAAPAEQGEIRFEEYSYLLKDDPLSRLRYMFSYEAWFRFIPVDLGLTAYKTVKGDLSEGKLGVRTSIAHIGEWSDDYQYGEDEVMKSRESEEKNRAPISEAGQEALLEVLSHFPGDEQTFRLAIKLFREKKEKRALFAGYLAKIGDDRAVPELLKAAKEPGLPYLTFIEIRNAIDTLGGTCPEREYDDDPEYEALRQMDMT